jgi:hypothetical protein
MIECDLYDVGFSENKLHVIQRSSCFIKRKTLIIKPVGKLIGKKSNLSPIEKMLTDE